MKSRTLRLEEMESRLVPAVVGIPWSDAQNITVSFVADGTQGNAQASSLDATLARTGATKTAYQTEMLRAIQQWVNAANLNVALVADGGQALGVAGTMQHDPRFGDIRISAEALGDDIKALAVPPGLQGGTLAGDILLNSNVEFSLGGTKTDLFTVMMHEAGHALGVGEDATAGSVMTDYAGAKTGLGATDIGSIQALYGIRQGDGFESGRDNNTMKKAAALARPAGFAATSTLYAQADLTTATDVDWYSFTTGATNPNGATINLNASKFSLLQGKLSVHDAAGKLLGSAEASGPGRDLTVRLASVAANTKYLIKVEKAVGTAFAIGAYEVEIVHTAGAPRVAAVGTPAPVNDVGADDTIRTAAALTVPPGYAAFSHYEAHAKFNTSSDVDWYSFRTPTQGTGGAFNVSAWSVSGAVAPQLEIYDIEWRPVQAVVLDNGNGMLTIQVPIASANTTWYVAVRQAVGGADTYRLSINAALPNGAAVEEQSGTLSASSPEVWQEMTTSETDLRLFTLSATGSQANAFMAMTIYDLNGVVLGSLTALPGQSVTGSFLLPAGSYYVRFSGATIDGSTLLPISYDLSSASIGDPIGVLMMDGSTTTTSTTSKTSSSMTTTTSPDPALMWTTIYTPPFYTPPLYPTPYTPPLYPTYSYPNSMYNPYLM